VGPSLEGLWTLTQGGRKIHNDTMNLQACGWNTLISPMHATDVQGLHEGSMGGVEGAWRARQRAGFAVCIVNDFFVQRLAICLGANSQVSVLLCCGCLYRRVWLCGVF
jgi:hypothetical protein